MQMVGFGQYRRRSRLLGHGFGVYCALRHRRILLLATHHLPRSDPTDVQTTRREYFLPVAAAPSRRTFATTKRVSSILRHSTPDLPPLLRATWAPSSVGRDERDVRESERRQGWKRTREGEWIGVDPQHEHRRGDAATTNTGLIFERCSGMSGSTASKGTSASTTEPTRACAGSNASSSAG